MSTASSNSMETLEALDPNLPLLASQAAIELDCLIRGRQIDLTATKHLGLLLRKLFEKPEEAPAIDPMTLTLVSRALHESHWDQPARTVKDLSEQAWELAKNLQEPTSKLEALRSFCAALSEFTSTYLESLYSRGPSHEYRRLRL